MAVRFAAALSFYTLFSLVPLLFLTVAIVGFVSTDSALTGAECDSVTVATIPSNSPNPLDRAILQAEEVAGREVSNQFAQLTCQAGANRQQALWIGIALAAFSGSSIFLHVQGVLNHIFMIPEERTQGVKNLVAQRGVALGSALLLAILVFVPLVAVAGVNFIRDLIGVTWVSNLVGVAVPLTSLLVLVVVTGLTFQLLTRAPISWQAARRGGIFTALTALVGAFLVGTYLRYFGGAGALGAVGGAAILLFFFNLMWMIYLFGAEVTKVYSDYLEYGDVMPPSLRERERRRARLEAARRQADTDSPVRTGILAFVIGLVTGWAARRGP